MTDKLELHIIETEKIEENVDERDGLIDWIQFINNPNSERVMKKMEENGAIKEAKEKLDKMSEDPTMQQLAWWREKAIYEENTRMSSAYKEGVEKGKQQEKIKTIKNMLKEKIDIKTICKIVKVEKEFIEKIEKEM